MRVMGYLESTQSKKRGISPRGIDRFEVFIDAEFAGHEDGKGQSAIVVAVGGTATATTSRKQKIATRDSTEAELVALSDLVLIGEWVDEYLQFSYGQLEKPIVFQDNRSTMTLVTEIDSDKMMELSTTG